MQTFQEFLTKELADSGLNDEQITSALVKLSGHEKLGPKLNSLVKTATEDYNAQVGRVQSAQQQVKDYQDWYNGEGKYQGRGAKATVEQIQARNAQLQAENQRLQNGGLPPELDVSKFLTKEDLESSLKDMSTRYASTIKAASRIAARHVAKFGEEPDMDEIDKIAAARMADGRGGSLDEAYQDWIRPRMQEQEKAAQEKWKKETREQIERDLRSQMHLPPETRPVEQSMLYHKPAQDTLPKDVDADLLEHWNKAATTA